MRFKVGRSMTAEATETMQFERQVRYDQQEGAGRQRADGEEQEDHTR
jgi:hypothetical protein